MPAVCVASASSVPPLALVRSRSGTKTLKRPTLSPSSGCHCCSGAPGWLSTKPTDSAACSWRLAPSAPSASRSTGLTSASTAASSAAHAASSSSPASESVDGPMSSRSFMHVTSYRHSRGWRDTSSLNCSAPGTVLPTELPLVRYCVAMSYSRSSLGLALRRQRSTMAGEISGVLSAAGLSTHAPCSPSAAAAAHRQSWREAGAVILHDVRPAAPPQ
mmetsp:Transcript_70910/g.194476  ORF Transcript_70910/g.194476 Transcript_70910/m.194476 type:complete len:217 (-) Transcript_70910:5-655(-)